MFLDTFGNFFFYLNILIFILPIVRLTMLDQMVVIQIK